LTLVADLAARFIPCRARLESLPSLNWQNDLAALAPLALLERCPYFVEMQINSKRLTEDCAKAQAVLAASGRAHCGTGATAIIEPALPLIRDLRRQKHSWSAIAAALGRQGVVQGVDRRPITPRRLTALIAAIEKRERRRTERQRGRCMRQDLAHHGELPSRLMLSGDLADILPSPTASDDSEERIRREALEGLQTLLKKG
jgi:hypothetical protein